MDTSSKNLDWTLVQSFCAVARQGSLSGAARSLGQSQPTVGRHIKTLEQSLGVDLFTRAARGLTPTSAGLEILHHAQAMEQSAARLRLAAEGRSVDLRGTVRITASVVMSHFILPDILCDIRQKLPEVQLELVPADTTENLIFREADIAIRMYRPTQLDVVAKHVCDQPTGLYAASSFLDRTGRPDNHSDIMELDFVGFDKNDVIIRAMADLGYTVDREFFPIRCDDQAAYWHLVRAGGGIGGAQQIIGDRDQLVERVLPDLTMPALPIWLAAPEALRTNPRIRAIWDLLDNALAATSGA